MCLPWKLNNALLTRNLYHFYNWYVVCCNYNNHVNMHIFDSFQPYILGYSVTTCEEPVREDLSLETLKCMKDFCKLKWYRKVKHMIDERLPFKLL